MVILLHTPLSRFTIQLSLVRHKMLYDKKVNSVNVSTETIIAYVLTASPILIPNSLTLRLELPVTHFRR